MNGYQELCRDVGPLYFEMLELHSSLIRPDQFHWHLRLPCTNSPFSNPITPWDTFLETLTITLSKRFVLTANPQ
jgi:hypothetical protein